MLNIIQIYIVHVRLIDINIKAKFYVILGPPLYTSILLLLLNII